MTDVIVKSKSISPGDFLARRNTSNGQALLALSTSPLTEGESYFDVNDRMGQTGAFEFEGSLSQRVRHNFVSAQAIGSVFEAAPDDMTIASIYQSSAADGAVYNATAGTVLTILLDNALPSDVFLSDWLHVYGLVDNRLNYPNLAIRWISLDRKTLVCGFSDEVALPSLAVTITPPAGTAKIKFYNNMGGAKDGAGYRFTGTSTTSAAIISLFDGNDVQISGTLQGDHRVTVGTTAPVFNAAVTGNAEIKASSRYRIESNVRDIGWLDKSVDTNVSWSQRQIRTSVKPRAEALRPRFRVTSPKSLSRPICKIVSVSKSGTTTATVNTDLPHGLVTNNYITAKGVRDVTNFAPITTPVQVTVVTPTQFTVPWGSAVTATSYGGSVVIANGGVDQPGIIGQTVQSAVFDAVTGMVTLVGNTNWAGLNVGEYVDAHGLRDNATGADLGLDGAWQVENITTTSLTLGPIVDVDGVRVSPVVSSLSLTNCGGTIILRTTLRVHDVVCDDWANEQRVVIDGAGTGRSDRAIPVRMVVNDTGSTTQNVTGSVAVDSAMGNPIAAGGRASNANIAAMSAAGDLVGWLMTMIGAGIVKPYSIPEADWSYTGTLTTNADTAMQAAGGAGIKRYLTALQVQNTNATATTLIVKDGTTARWTVSLPASMTLPIDIYFPTPLQTTANAALNIACGTTGANVLVNAQGYTAP